MSTGVSLRDIDKCGGGEGEGGAGEDDAGGEEGLGGDHRTEDG
jgi:hypothetical protein